jgi:hypothetical protein
MVSWQRIARIIVLAGASGLMGCAVVDQYSGRAIVYNLEAEQAQEEGLLLNIVRAYLHRPMQFTTVSSITGVANVSGGAQYSLPTNVPFRPPVQGATGVAQFPPLPTWQLTGSMSGGPAFTIPVLDTQEFYQGILKAIPGQIWDLYLQANYPPDLLFNLFVMKVVMHKTVTDCPKYDHTSRCELVFENYVGNDSQIDSFQALGDYLMWLGLTTERPKPSTVELGPTTTNINVRYVGNASPSNPNIAEVLGPPGGSAPGDSQAPPKPYRLCFAPRNNQNLVNRSALCGYEKEDKKKELATSETNTSKEFAASEINSSGSASVVLTVNPEFIDRLRRIAHNDAADAPNAEADLDRFSSSAGRDMFTVAMTVYMRHTEGMIYYLGELARRALTRDYGEYQRDIFTKQGNLPINRYSDYEKYTCTAPSKYCAYIFHLRQGFVPTSGEFVSAAYNGHWYSISSAYDPNRPDRSSLSLDFLKQLIAINSSAKSLPQSSVLSVVGGQ